MKIKTTVILQILRWLAFIAFVGFAIETGAIIISFIVSFRNPDTAKNLYKGLDLHELKAYGNWVYYVAVVFLAFIAGLKSNVWMNVMTMLSHLKFDNPFSPDIIKFLKRISDALIAIWVIGLLYNILAKYLEHKTGNELMNVLAAGNFLFMAGLVFVIMQVFKRGLEIQSENELTV
ncbi:DUF2975 domain-containing protein [Parafilimonas sp.]|uniref:DUF2975 domain-containing protein n=1 Tax=Parafilimonas sp. TaxID=1969739 RepID=UPI0039E5639E